MPRPWRAGPAVLIGLTLVLVACSAPGVGAIPSDGSATAVATQDATPTEQPTPSPTPRPTPRPTPTPVARADLEVTEYGFSTWQEEFDDGARLSWAVVVSNPNPADSWLATSTDVRVSFYDAGGGVISSATDTVALLLPGGQAALVGSDSPFSNPDLGLIASMDVRLGQPQWEEADGPLGAFEVSGVQVRTGQFGDSTVTGQVASTFADEIEDAYAVAVCRDAAGAIIGGDFTFIEFIPSGETTPFEISGFGSPPGTSSADVFVTFSFLSLQRLCACGTQHRAIPCIKGGTYATLEESNLGASHLERPHDPLGRRRGRRGQ
jgi:hypothetical protein